MPTPPKQGPQAVRLDNSAKAEIEALAKELGISKSALIRIAITKGLPKVREAFS